ncbi:protein-tyrosine phosphatase family protein [Halodesulfovibrio spirochaetisodalis]|uniref:Protein tyrosine phosphatase n=1 Tax=Halodesulfovibrio spirochaetisodalis TaxID=1560234 RepID=A0A1B7X9A9_9BACT|nr:protein-tyrosine phosphatase family protein [Halodesulfovibrio spirochaetisodalis]OBQ45965.1 hypothetical protein SP90_15225 [Halodesulfovibrio spirochaetisodalis]
MPISNNFQAQVQAQVNLGRGDEIGRLSAGDKQEVKGTSEAKGNLKQKLFGRNQLSSKTTDTQKAFADKVVSELNGKVIDTGDLKSYFDNLKLGSDGSLKGITDNLLTHNQALELLAAAKERPSLTQPERPPKPAAMTGEKMRTGAQPSVTEDTIAMIGDEGRAKDFHPQMAKALKERLGDGHGALVLQTTSQYYNNSDEMKAVCRFKDLKPPKETLVNTSKLINANYVTLGGKEYGIATQAPKVETQEAFWTMVSEAKVTTILDLTRRDDIQKHHIPKYRPHGEQLFGDVEVAATSRKRDGVMNVTNMEVSGQTGMHDVKALHFPDWPDHGVVKMDTFKEILSTVKNATQNNPGNLAIHCTAGVGRTGTIFAGLALSDMAASGELTRDNVDEKLLDVIVQGRQSRGQFFVQTHSQAALLLEYAHGLVGA